jgi:tetratricopeptide (TPR) repeat protein
VSLGTALEQQGEIERAEKGLRRAVELAPSYSYPRWYLGNLLLRSGRYTEAFAELRRASESDPQFRPQLFNLAWEVYSNDLESLKTVVGLSAAANADFSQYLLQRERFDDGLRIWHSLNDSDKRANSEAANRIIATLLTARRFHDAMAVWNGLVESPIHRAEVDKVLDGSFEQNVPHGAESVFGWQVKSISQLQVGIDTSVRKSGQRSLRLTFQVASRLDKINVAQLVAVQPATEYEFECFVKTKGLSTAAPPLIQIVDAASGSVLASTSEVPIGENDNWLRLNTVFKSGDQSQGVIVRISRGSCGDNSVCPIYGSIWYDDFTITRRS